MSAKVEPKFCNLENHTRLRFGTSSRFAMDFQSFIYQLTARDDLLDLRRDFQSPN